MLTNLLYEGAWKEKEDKSNPIEQFINRSTEWEEEEIISNGLRDKIIENIQNKSFGFSDQLRIWKTIFLIFRIESRDEHYIFKATKMENGIGQKFSEKVSFLLDCLNAYVTATKSFEKYCDILTNLSQAVFYGINPNVLCSETELAKDIIGNKKRLQHLSRDYCRNLNRDKK